MSENPVGPIPPAPYPTQTLPPAPQPPFPPVPPKGPAAARGLAVSALVVGIVAFLSGFAPVFGLLVGAAAIGLGVFALIKKQSKGLAIAGISLGALGALTSLLMTVGLALSGGVAAESVKEGVEAAQTEKPAAEPAPEPEPKPEPEKPAAPPVELGSIGSPYPQPYTAEGIFGGEKYTLTAGLLNTNAGAQIAEWNMFNSEAPSGYKYVVIELTMTGIDSDGVEPSLAGFDLQLATAEGNRYDEEYVIFGEGMPSMSDGPKLYPGSAFTGYMAFMVPSAAESFYLYDNGNYISF